MYHVVKPHKKFEDSNGIERIPVATLKDQDSVCHVVVDDGCYVVYLYSEETGFIPTHYLFSEVHSVLKTLPNLE